MKQITEPPDIYGEAWNGRASAELVRFNRQKTRQAMRQELRGWRSETGSRRWLSALIAAMETAAHPEPGLPAIALDTLEQFRAQLALPASCHLHSDPRIRH